MLSRFADGVCSYFESVEGFCQGFNRLHVQMIRRLIQNVEVGAINERQVC